LEADGGTRTAAITGAQVALGLAVRRGQADGRLGAGVLRGRVAAVSVGIVDGRALLDLCYAEDAAAEVDMNVAMTAGGRFVELQGASEATPFTAVQLDAMLRLARRGIRNLLALQREAMRK
jgi:ribonuclease PH